MSFISMETFTLSTPSHLTHNIYFEAMHNLCVSFCHLIFYSWMMEDIHMKHSLQNSHGQ